MKRKGFILSSNEKCCNLSSFKSDNEILHYCCDAQLNDTHYEFLWSVYG